MRKYKLPIRQGFRKVSSDRQTDRQRDTTEIKCHAAVGHDYKVLYMFVTYSLQTVCRKVCSQKTVSYGNDQNQMKCFLTNSKISRIYLQRIWLVL